MTIDHFPQEVIEKLKWYVYRLVDPRNGETFYVGKGKNNRVFNHVKGISEDAATHTTLTKLHRGAANPIRYCDP